MALSKVVARFKDGSVMKGRTSDFAKGFSPGTIKRGKGDVLKQSS